MMRLSLSDLDEAAILALNETPEDFCFLTFNAIAERGMPRCEVRRVVRKLARMGITKFQSGLWTDDGEPVGSGYALTSYGRAVASVIEARPVSTPLNQEGKA